MILTKFYKSRFIINEVTSQRLASAGANCIVIDLTESFSNLDVSQLYRIINGKVTKKRGTWIQFIVLSHHDKVEKISRQQILNGLLLEKLKALK